MEPLEADDPRQVGRFEIVSRLGSGGMGRVYLARSASGEQFALKMIHQFLSDDVQFRRRFQREVSAAQRVTGENTAALVDADPDGRTPWMATEYVAGPTLSELIDSGGPLALHSCVRLASGMAQALISIHAAGLVHRDLKPSNVLMSTSGARLIDFGIAQASGASSLTMTGLVPGSAGFMSPEQAQAEQVTAASDVFALGTVLYFAATGRRPFGEGSMISVTYRVVHADPDLSGIRDDGLRELIANCLMKDPARRPTPEEISQRCPGIADGTWVHGRDAPTTSTLTVASTEEQPAPLALPALPEPRSGAVPQPIRRDDPEPSGRGFVTRPWLAFPVAGMLVLGVGAAIALSLGAGGAEPPAGTNTGTSPRPPVHRPDVTASRFELPTSHARPTNFETPNRPGPRPTTRVTATPTTQPTTTTAGGAGPTTSPGTGPSAGGPRPTKSPDPTGEPTIGPTDGQTPDPSPSGPAETAAGGVAAG